MELCGFLYTPGNIKTLTVSWKAPSIFVHKLLFKVTSQRKKHLQDMWHLDYRLLPSQVVLFRFCRWFFTARLLSFGDTNWFHNFPILKPGIVFKIINSSSVTLSMTSCPTSIHRYIHTYLLARTLGAFQRQRDKAQWIKTRPQHRELRALLFTISGWVL